MKNQLLQILVNKRQQRKPRSYSQFPLFAPVQISFLAIACACTITHAQCYIDPYTGRQICTRPITPTQPPIVSNGVIAAADAAHCRISIANGTLGSGTIVDRGDNTALVLTCAHQFDDPKSRIVVSVPRAGLFAARLVEVDTANDLAALAIRRPDASPLQVADQNPDSSECLTACGYGPNGQFRRVSGKISGHATAKGATYPSTVFSAAVRPGDSGGAVLNADGQLVGVVWGQRDGQTYATCGQPVYDFLNRLRSNRVSAPVIATTPSNSQPPALPGVPSPSFDWQTWTAELDARLRALDAKKQDRGDYLQPGDLNAYVKSEDLAKRTGALASRTDVESKITEVASRFESVHATIESIRERVTTLTADGSGFWKGASIAKLAAGALGLSGPLAAAIIIAAGFLGRRMKSRVNSEESRARTSPALDSRLSALDSPPIAIDTPPPPQRSVPETHYVPIERDTFAKAHQWASEHVARKYPGATEVLQTQDSLIKQFLAAK
jgi:hypothetical protein